MTLIIVLSVIAAIVVIAIILFFALGIRAQVYYNSDYNNITADIFVFSRLHAVKVKLFKVNNVLYCQVGNRNIRKLKASARVSRAEARRPLSITEIMSSMKGIRLKSINIACYVGAGEGADTAMLYCGVNSVLLNALNVISPIVKDDKYDVVCVPDFDKSVLKARVDIAIGWGMLQIIMRILRIIYTGKRLNYGK